MNELKVIIREPTSLVEIEDIHCLLDLFIYN